MKPRVRQPKSFPVLSPLPKGWVNDEKRIFTQLRHEQILDCNVRMRGSCPADYLDEADILLTWGSVRDCNITFLYKQGKHYCLYVKDDYKPRFYPVDNLAKFLEEQFQKEDLPVYGEESTDEEVFGYDDGEDFEEEDDDVDDDEEEEESTDEGSKDEAGESREGGSLNAQPKNEQVFNGATNPQQTL